MEGIAVKRVESAPKGYTRAMRVTWYTNACVRISSSDGSSILCDPWVNSGAFLGSWFHWPPIENGLEKSLLDASCDGIFVSHLHPDHYDPKFLSKFSKARPDVPIYIAEFAHPWLKQSLHSVVKKKSTIVEVPALTEVAIGPDLAVKLFAADTCNPSVCGVSIPCHVDPAFRGIDSIGVFTADGQVVVNANDAMGVNLVPRIAANVGRADLLMGHYGGASPFPQCFPDISDKRAAARRIVETTCQMLSAASDALDVQYIMPFAGQYVLGGRLAHLNEDRATLPLDQAVSYLKTITKREIISMNPGGFIDLSSQVKSCDYVEPDSEVMANYLETIAKVKFSYEQHRRDGTWKDVDADLLDAAKSVAERSTRSNVSAEVSFIIGDGNNWVTIDLDPTHKNTSVKLGRIPAFPNVTEISMPTELLRRLSTRKKNYRGFTTLHWNQADVGSHFTWKRVGEYDPGAHWLLNFYGV